jgi:type-F conjugative transfer system pilin assembly protein TrbC
MPCNKNGHWVKTLHQNCYNAKTDNNKNEHPDDIGVKKMDSQPLHATSATQCTPTINPYLLALVWMLMGLLHSIDLMASEQDDVIVDLWHQAEQSRAAVEALVADTQPTITDNPDAIAQGVLVFVSLGMPDNALRQLLQQAADFNVPVIIRGVYQNSFAHTVTRIQQLLGFDDDQRIDGGVAINPHWFQQFGITQVPAFVAVRAGRCIPPDPCDPHDYDLLYGNVSLYDALQILATEGDVPDVAHHVLAVAR